MKIGYLRVSTKTQRPDRQINGLKELCDRLYIETLSAVADKRPVFDQVLNELGSVDIHLDAISAATRFQLAA